MSEKTVCVSIGELAGAQGWAVYRVRTASSTYHVAIAPAGARRFAVLRGYSVGVGRVIDVCDSAPQVGDASLFDVAPGKWSGKPLAFGTTVTSHVIEAAPETDAAVRTVVTSALVARPVPSSERDRVPYPEDWVEHAELAAAVLRQLYQRKGLLEDIEQRPAMHERLNVALAECALLLRAIAGRLDVGRRK